MAKAEVRMPEIREAVDKNVNPDFRADILTEGEVEERITFMALQIAHDYRGRNPLIVVVQNGADYFAKVLTSELRRLCPGYEPRIMNVAMSTSDEGSNLRQPFIKEGWPKDIDLTDEDVLIVEDIRDRGDTLHHLVTTLEAANAREVKIAALLERVIPDRPAEFKKPRYVGYRIYGDGWAVGSGLDDHRMVERGFPDGGRSLPGVILNNPPA